jgi:hypothetical protein
MTLITEAELVEAEAKGDPILTVGSGPLSFDVEMARDHGWSLAEISFVYNQIHAVVRDMATAVANEHPELWEEQELFGEKVKMFVGDRKKP